jgi:beta-lactamase regulating signal transducer with metallopeptidase domain
MTFASVAAAVVANALWQDTLVALAGAVLLRGLTRRAAAERHRVALALTIVAVALPIAGAMAPPGAIRQFRPALAAPAATASPIAAADGEAAARPASVGNRPAIYVAWGYAAAVGIRLGMVFLAAVGASRLRRRAEPLPAAAARALLDTAAAPSVCRRRISIRVSREADVPHVWGILSDAIVLPERLRAAPPTVQAAVIGHEAAHIGRRDAQVAFAVEVLSALVPFHPCVWWLKRQAARYRELACDRIALETTRLAPAEYARALVAVAAGGGRRVPWPAPAFGEVPLLEERIRAILARAPEPPLDPRVALTAAAIAAAAVVPLGAASARIDVPPASLAGRWTLDRAATRVPSALALLRLEIEIAGVDGGLRIRQVRENYSRRPDVLDFRLPTDGTPVDVPLPNDRVARVTARWTAGRLIVDSTIRDTGERDRDELSSDGRRLTIDGVLTGRNGPLSHTYVLVRADAPDLKVGPTR